MSAGGVTLYFRSTDGKGERIFLDAELPVPRLYQIIAKKVSKEVDEIKLYAHGKQIAHSPAIYRPEPQSILHVTKKKHFSSQSKMISVTINWQHFQYQYHLNTLSTISHLKKQMLRDIAQWNRVIVLSYLGRQLNDQQTLADAQIEDSSKLSMCMALSSELASSNPLMGKIAKSLAFQQQPRIEVKKKQKSLSGELFADTRRFEFTGHSVIETVSIHDSSEDNNPDFWNNCEFAVMNKDKTKYYTFDCGQDHKLEHVLKQLGKLQRCEISSIFWVTNKGQLRDMQEEHLLEIARQRTTQTLGPYVFEVKT